MCSTGEYQIKNHARILGKFSDDLGVNDGFERFLEEAYDKLFQQRGYIYAPQRMPLDFPGRSRLKHIFFLRDPRDVLVSAYHSFAFTHRPPHQPLAREAFEQRRKTLQSRGVDDYALESCEIWIKPLLASYRHLRETSNTNVFMSYDEYRENPSDVMNRIAEYLEVRINPVERDSIARRAMPITSKIDDRSHKRSGRSGQFRDSLNLQTQKLINEKLVDELEYWGFPKS